MSRQIDSNVNQAVYAKSNNPFIISQDQQKQLALSNQPKRYASSTQQWTEGFWELSENARLQFAQSKMPIF